MLRDRTWRVKYTAEHGDLVQLFYVPALEDAHRYDRLTGYFNATALALAARGVEGLVRHNGRMRLVVGCTLEAPEIEAIERGEQLRTLVERHLTNIPLAPPNPESENALELLAWMVARGGLDVKVAVPCNARREPVPDDGIFHEKTGIVEDRGGNRLAWTGSLNETGAGWQSNWESISVYTSWGSEPERVDAEELNFARIWAGSMGRVIVLDVPEAVRRDLLRFKPATGLPSRLKQKLTDASAKNSPISTLAARVWSFIREAPSRPGSGNWIGESTAPVNPWPHQARAFERLYRNWPPRLLIADEVGLGKTIQAGLMLRQAWLAGRAKRILILAPKSVVGQWQVELREKFNLNWPIYDGNKLLWYPSPALQGQHARDAKRWNWHREPAVIVSSQLVRRSGRATELLETAEPWDIVVLDEAHHARRRGAGSQREGGPNTLLRLMRALKDRTQGLVLLTATPMQVHPVEVWDLLDLLGLPPEWSESAFLQFFADIEQPRPTRESMERMALLFRSAEDQCGKFDTEHAQRLTDLSRVKIKKVLRALRDTSSIPRRQLDSDERRGSVAIMRAGTPVRRLISRNTRELLRHYFRRGMITTPIAERKVEDRFLDLTSEERTIYDAVEDYIIDTYSRASAKERSAVGFVMTIYRRRLASSFVALRETLRKRRDAIVDGGRTDVFGHNDDLPDDDAADEMTEPEQAANLERRSLALEQEAEIDRLLAAIALLPPDSKLGNLKTALRALREAGYAQAMVFTQFTDTMDFLRDALLKDGEWTLLCFSGRGGEAPRADGSWRVISRDDAKQRFWNQQADILLCTDAAAEGLNFQFCGAVVNYDMPWNPMRVEQRIGRIDRLGQKHGTIRIVNLHYSGTVETDIYRALRGRIGLFEVVVGRLQPILARLPKAISQSVLAGQGRDSGKRTELVASIEREASDEEGPGFDIDSVTEDDLVMPSRAPSSVTMEDLDRVVASDGLLAPNIEVQSMGQREYRFLAPDMRAPLRVTTDPDYFERHSDSVELWSPGNPLFVPPTLADSIEADPSIGTLKEILDGG